MYLEGNANQRRGNIIALVIGLILISALILMLMVF
jgi:hypothetical protein